MKMEQNTDAVISKLTARMTPPPTDARTCPKNWLMPLHVPMNCQDPVENIKSTAVPQLATPSTAAQRHLLFGR
jgi:hypothetical protein